MFFQRRTTPGLAIYSYVIGDSIAKKAIVIDPVRDVGEYITIAEQNHLRIDHILETHVHADYVSGSFELKARLGGYPKIYCSGMGGEDWIPSYVDVVVKDGDEFHVGALTIKAVHTPGHTPEHIMWVILENDVPKQLFTGDFLFVGDVGRPDLLGAEKGKILSHDLYKSVFNILNRYSDDLEIHPAHGAGSLCGKSLGTKPSSTLGIERKENPSLKKQSEEQWTQELMRDMPPSPIYFSRMKKVNVEGPSLIGEKKIGHRALSPLEFKAEIERGSVILDLRSKEEYADQHIPGSISIPFNPQLSKWSGSLLSPNEAIVLVLESEGYLEEAVNALIRVGLDDITGYLEGGVEAWENQPYEIADLKTMSPDDLNELLKADPKSFVLDVRTTKEWNEGHIKGAKHIPVGEVIGQVEQLPKDESIFVICGSGSRSSIVCSLLLRQGFGNVSNIVGGMRGWNESGFPVSVD